MRFQISSGVLAVHALLCSPAFAQEVRGRVLDAATLLPVAAVEVRLLEGAAARLVMLSDSVGRFSLRPNRTGSYSLRAERIGYVAVTTQPFKIASAELVEVELLISVAPLEFEALRVTARSTASNAYLEASGFYARQHVGLGHFLTRRDIERQVGVQLSDVLRRVPGVRIVRADRGGRRGDVLMTRASLGSRCLPSIFLDGVLSRIGGPPRATDVSIDDMVLPTDLEGIEVYNGPSQAQAPYDRYAECGAIVIWTKRRL